jgi:hypothetical protein
MGPSTSLGKPTLGKSTIFFAHKVKDPILTIPLMIYFVVFIAIIAWVMAWEIYDFFARRPARIFLVGIIVAGMIFLVGTIDIAWEAYAWEVYYFFAHKVSSPDDLVTIALMIFLGGIIAWEVYDFFALRPARRREEKGYWRAYLLKETEGLRAKHAEQKRRERAAELAEAVRGQRWFDDVVTGRSNRFSIFYGLC